MFLSFSRENHAESFINFVKIQFVDPKRAKLNPNSDFGHVRTCPGGQVLTANQRKYFYFLRCYTFPFFTSKFYHFYKIICFTKRIYHFYKIICFTKRAYHFYKIMCFTEQIYEDKSLSPTHVLTFKISSFTTFIFLLIICMIFHEN